MKFDLPNEIGAACAPLFDAIPLNSAMSGLVGGQPAHAELVTSILRHPALEGRPELAAALWLYVDDLSQSHTISQGIETLTGSYWHGIMHRREGDFSNSHYWMRRAAGHPLRQQRPDLDADEFIDLVAADGNRNAAELLGRQRAEWKALFEWCAAQSSNPS